MGSPKISVSSRRKTIHVRRTLPRTQTLQQIPQGWQMLIKQGLKWKVKTKARSLSRYKMRHLLERKQGKGKGKGTKGKKARHRLQLQVQKGKGKKKGKKNGKAKRKLKWRERPRQSHRDQRKMLGLV